MTWTALPRRVQHIGPTVLCMALLCFCACGTPAPKSVTTEDGRTALELPYCLDATECFVTADQTCPRGYDVVRWQSSRPHIIICK